jgi:hypothetical protein
MTRLSLTGSSRYAERIVKGASRPVPAHDVIARLVVLGVDLERAQAGVRLAVTVGRLVHIDDCLRLPDPGGRELASTDLDARTPPAPHGEKHL